MLTLQCRSSRPPSRIHLHSNQSLWECRCLPCSAAPPARPPASTCTAIKVYGSVDAYLTVLLPRPPSSIHLHSNQSLWECRCLPCSAAPPARPPASTCKAFKVYGSADAYLESCPSARPPASTCTAFKVYGSKKLTRLAFPSASNCKATKIQREETEAVESWQRRFFNLKRTVYYAVCTRDMDDSDSTARFSDEAHHRLLEKSACHRTLLGAVLQSYRQASVRSGLQKRLSLLGRSQSRDLCW